MTREVQQAADDFGTALGDLINREVERRFVERMNAMREMFSKTPELVLGKRGPGRPPKAATPEAAPRASKPRKRPRRIYPMEYKIQVAKEAVEAKKDGRGGVARIAKREGLSEGTVYGWMAGRDMGKKA